MIRELYKLSILFYFIIYSLLLIIFSFHWVSFTIYQLYYAKQIHISFIYTWTTGIEFLEYNITPSPLCPTLVFAHDAVSSYSQSELSWCCHLSYCSPLDIPCSWIKRTRRAKCQILMPVLLLFQTHFRHCSVRTCPCSTFVAQRCWNSTVFHKTNFLVQTDVEWHWLLWSIILLMMW